MCAVRTLRGLSSLWHSHLASENETIPYAAPSTGAFGGNRVRHGCRTLTKGQEPLSATPVESEERRTNRQDSRFACIAPEGRGTGMCRVIQAASGSPFLWILSFGEAKESISPSGAITRSNQASR
jgi:hypothetical protein